MKLKISISILFIFLNLLFLNKNCFSFESKLEQEFNNILFMIELEERLDQLENNLEERLDQLENNLEEKLEKLNIDGKLTIYSEQETDDNNNKKLNNPNNSKKKKQFKNIYEELDELNRKYNPK